VLAAPRFVQGDPLPAEVAELFDTALRALEHDLGLPVEPIETERIFGAGDLDADWLTLTSTEHAHKLGRDTIEAGRHLMHPAGRAFLEHGLRTPIEEYLAARRRRFEYVRELDELLGTDGVIATPTLASAGWLAEGRMPGSERLGVPDEVYNTEPANVTGHPSLSLPAGRFASGVCFGLQLTGPRFRDDLLLDLGEEWQRARPWPLAADGYEPFDLPL
jgi:Asp-tRNA(Asn)/Glu-tRNA(Gln) amidotransferase A subunit family amidase